MDRPEQKWKQVPGDGLLGALFGVLYKITSLVSDVQMQMQSLELGHW